MEALAYVLIYLINGTLPWVLEARPEMAQNLPNLSKAMRYQIITSMKQNLKLNEIAAQLPVEFEDFLRYTRALRFTDRPDYGYLKKMFDAVLFRLQIPDFSFDWKIKHVTNT